jgi:hypothetical protein
LWALCREFKILPNDPRLKDLTVAQIQWLLFNMAEDRKNLKKALRNTKKQKAKVYSALGQEDE